MPHKELSGDKPFLNAGKEQGFHVKDYWRWAYSNILNNTDRGIVAEFLVAQALGSEAKKKGDPWEAYDLKYKGWRIEVKSSAYWQAWDLVLAQKKESVSPGRPAFGTAQRKRWDKRKRKYTAPACRWADVYVFCLLGDKHPQTGAEDPLELSQWKFWVVSKNFLDNQLGDQKKAALSTIERLAEKVDYGGIKKAVDDAIG